MGLGVFGTDNTHSRVPILCEALCESQRPVCSHGSQTSLQRGCRQLQNTEVQEL